MSVAARERVLAAAPDAAARTTAARLRWLEAGRSQRCAWGRCQGSAPAPYQTVVLAGDELHSACTCPSRRRPCKHALGLLLRWADDQLSEASEPDFAAQAATRLAAGAGRVEPPRRPVDAEAAARRAEQRRQRVADGLDELERWLADQVRAGLAELPRAGYPHVDAVAARMVDAQAPGVAGTLRSIPADLVGDGWPERVLHQLAGLYLLARAHRRLDELPVALAATVRSRVGYPVAKADVLATPPVADLWWPLGGVDTVEYQLETRRVWLRGARTGRWAMWLAFAPPGQTLDDSVRPGTALAAELHFYPGSGQYRALVGTRPDDPTAPGTLPGSEPLRVSGESLTEVAGRFADLVAADPWASRMPAVVCGVPVPPRVADAERRWRLRDADGRCCDLVGVDGELWPLVAQAGGEPLGVFGEWGPAGLLPLSVVPDEHGRRFSTVVTG